MDFPNNTASVCWAAGLFNGEGSTIVSKSGSLKYVYLRIGQNDPQVLKIFGEIVEYGNLQGPYEEKYKRPDGTYRKIYMWRYQVAAQQEVDEVLKTLWPYLSNIKKLQAMNAIANYNTNFDVPESEMTRGKSTWFKRANFRYSLEKCNDFKEDSSLMNAHSQLRELNTKSDPARDGGEGNNNPSLRDYPPFTQEEKDALAKQGWYLKE